MTERLRNSFFITNVIGNNTKRWRFAGCNIWKEKSGEATVWVGKRTRRKRLGFILARIVCGEKELRTPIAGAGIHRSFAGVVRKVLIHAGVVSVRATAVLNGITDSVAKCVAGISCTITDGI